MAILDHVLPHKETSKGFTFPSNYPFVILSLWAVAMAYFFIYEVIVNYKRNKIFPKNFMEKHFAEEHKKEIGGPLPKSGYPDMGSGRYSDRLSYKDWYEFNNVQRAYYNFLEQLPMVVIFSLVAGLSFPIPVAIITGIYALGRVIYALGYILGGPNYRMPGALLSSTSIFFLSGAAGFGAVKSVLGL